MLINIEKLLKSYETDVSEPEGLGKFEAINMLTNRDILEEYRNRMTTQQSTRLLFADEKLLEHSEKVISECGGESEFMKLRRHNPQPYSWWWFLEQIAVEQYSHN